MMLRLLQLAVLIGLVAWTNECFDLSQSVSAFVQTVLDECGGAIGR
jgi:hypothetical protein